MVWYRFCFRQKSLSRDVPLIKTVRNLVCLVFKWEIIILDNGKSYWSQSVFKNNWLPVYQGLEKSFYLGLPKCVYNLLILISFFWRGSWFFCYTVQETTRWEDSEDSQKNKFLLTVHLLSVIQYHFWRSVAHYVQAFWARHAIFLEIA